jgi:hypothetical protein
VFDIHFDDHELEIIESALQRLADDCWQVVDDLNKQPFMCDYCGGPADGPEHKNLLGSLTFDSSEPQGHEFKQRGPLDDEELDVLATAEWEGGQAERLWLVLQARRGWLPTGHTNLKRVPVGGAKQL